MKSFSHTFNYLIVVIISGLSGIALVISVFTPLSHKLKSSGTAVYVRVLYGIFAVCVDIASFCELLPPVVVQGCSWGLLALSVIPYPRIRCNRNDQDKIASLFLRMAPVYILLSVSYEGLFIVAFYNVLQIWVSMSSKTRSNQTRKSKKGEKNGGANTPPFKFFGGYLVDVVLYLFLCYASFFSTGNIASISGFEVSSTYRFVTVFSPFTMTGLIGAKIFLPFLLVATAFFAVSKAKRQVPTNSFFMAIALSDFIAIVFFFLVRDTGSWRDIGMTIGNFSIANLFILLQLILLVLSQRII